jgi:hypothetical protein
VVTKLAVPWRSINFFENNQHDVQASAAMFMKSAACWDITQRRVVDIYRRFGTSYQSHLQGSRSPRRKNLDFLTLEDGTGTLCRNVGKQLPNDAA